VESRPQQGAPGRPENVNNKCPITDFPTGGRRKLKFGGLVVDSKPNKGTWGLDRSRGFGLADI
jgi:hypothetical protein